MLEVLFFEEKLEQLKTTMNVEGRQWLRGLMREPEKWTRAYDDGGWRYEFQTSNIAKSFNSVLKGICAMPMNAIVSFTFYRLVACLTRDMLKQWNYRVIIRNGHLNLRSTLRRQRKGLQHMTSSVLTTTPASTRSRKGVVQRQMVRVGHQEVILWSLVIFHADVGEQGSTTLCVLIIL
jgi:hypothetical protein